MVTLLKLTTRNFKHLKGIGSDTFQLEFPTGTIAIQGGNEDGKTTLMEAIFFAIFGRTLVGERLDEYIAFGRDFADVQLEFRIGDRRFLVRRRINRKRPNQARLFEVIGEKYKPLGVTVSATNKALNQMLGLDQETFKSSVLVLQKDLKRLLEKDPSQRDELINAIMGRECYDVAIEGLKNRRKELWGTRGRKGEIEREKEKLNILGTKLRDYVKSENRLKEVDEEIDQLRSDIPRLEEKLGTVDAEVKLLDAYEEAKGQREKILKEMEASIRVRENLEDQREEKTRKIEKYMGFKEADDEFQNIREEITTLESQRDKFRSPILFVAGILTLIGGVLIAILVYLTQGIVITATGISLVAYWFKRIYFDVSKINIMIGKLRGEGEQLLTNAEKYRQILEIKKEVNAIDDKINGEITSIEGLREKIEAIELPELPESLTPFSKELLEEKRGEQRILVANFAGKRRGLEGLEEEKQGIEEYLEENRGIKEGVKKQSRKLQELEHELILVKETISAIDKTAEATRGKVRPSMEAYMAFILPKMTQNRYADVQLLEDFRIEVYDTDAKEYRLMDRFSGGTEDQFLLAMRLAFTLSLIPKMKGGYPRFLFLDEAFASSDSERRRAIMRLLSSDLRETFDQIIVVSHQEDVRRGAPYYLELDNGRITRKNW